MPLDYNPIMAREISEVARLAADRAIADQCDITDAVRTELDARDYEPFSDIDDADRDELVEAIVTEARERLSPAGKRDEEDEAYIRASRPDASSA
jgi:hypothetical protein